MKNRKYRFAERLFFEEKFVVGKLYLDYRIKYILLYFVHILAKLETQLAHESQEEVEKIKKEIDELKSLLPEIQMKIDDSLESARSLTKVSSIHNH